MAGKMIDYRLYDGYWISNVFIREVPDIEHKNDTNHMLLHTRFEGVPTIQLRDYFLEENVGSRSSWDGHQSWQQRIFGIFPA